MKTLIPLSLFWIALLCSCQNTSKEPYLKPGVDYVQLTPDSLRTPEQKAFLLKLTKIIYENLSVKNNEVYFELSEKEFVEKGMPIQYYDLVQKDVINMNKSIKENNITNFDSVLKESYRQILDSIQ